MNNNECKVKAKVFSTAMGQIVFKKSRKFLPAVGLLAALSFPAVLLGASPAAPKILLMAASTDVQASSTREDPDGRVFGFSPLNLLDADPDTAWCAGENLLGVGEWIEVGLLAPLALEQVGLIGTFLPEKASKTNPPYNRVQRIRLTNPLGEFRILEFRDTVELHFDKLDPLRGDRFRLTIESVYPGAERALTCISELEFRGRTESEGAAVDKLARKAISGDARKVFEEAFGSQRPASAGPKLKTGLSDFFGRYQNYSPISLARELVEFELPENLRRPPPDARADETACVAALRGLYEASPEGKRLLRERYFFKKEVPLGKGCGIKDDPLYWVLRGRPEALPLFWARGEKYGLLELGDSRVLKDFLLAFRGKKAGYHWWEKTPAVHSTFDRTPAELVGKLRGPHPRRVIEELLEKEKKKPGYYRDGLEALRSLAGG